MIDLKTLKARINSGEDFVYMGLKEQNEVIDRCTTAESEVASLRAALVEMERGHNPVACVSAAEFNQTIERAVNAEAALATARGLLKSGARIDQVAQTARALAMEEAARVIDDQGFIETHSNGEDHEEVPAGNRIRALVHLPQSLVAVPRETLALTKRALIRLQHRIVDRHPCWCFLWPDEPEHCESVSHPDGPANFICADAQAALAALKLEDP